MKKILIISTVGLIYDGITSVILSYLRVMDLSNFQIHVVSTIKCEESIKNELERMGCYVVDFPDRRKSTVSYFFALIKYIKKNKVAVVHAHGNSATLFIEMLAAWLGNCKKRIAHSHNTKCNQIRADKILRPLFYMLYTDAVACSRDAGEWLFPNREYFVLRNGRDTNMYAFNPIMREQMRQSAGVNNKVVVGHVGGFVEQKNHIFMLDIIRSLVKKNDDVVCYLIGDGQLREDIEQRASDIKDKVFFVGNTNRVSDYLQMMDVMVLPSLFEGFPLVVVEWQINGLPCVVSDTVTKDCKMTDLVKFVQLNNPASEWADTILAQANKERNSSNCENYVKQIRTEGFEIRDSAKILEALYEG